jgi:hypothetical protein
MKLRVSKKKKERKNSVSGKNKSRRAIRSRKVRRANRKTRRGGEKQKHCLGRSKTDCFFTKGCKFQKEPISYFEKGNLSNILYSNCVPKYCSKISKATDCIESNECTYDWTKNKCEMPNYELSERLNIEEEKYKEKARIFNMNFDERERKKVEKRNEEIMRNSKRAQEISRERESELREKYKGMSKSEIAYQKEMEEEDTLNNYNYGDDINKRDEYVNPDTDGLYILNSDGFPIKRYDGELLSEYQRAEWLY